MVGNNVPDAKAIAIKIAQQLAVQSDMTRPEIYKLKRELEAGKKDAIENDLPPLQDCADEEDEAECPEEEDKEEDEEEEDDADEKSDGESDDDHDERNDM